MSQLTKNFSYKVYQVCKVIKEEGGTLIWTSNVQISPDCLLIFTL